MKPLLFTLMLLATLAAHAAISNGQDLQDGLGYFVTRDFSSAEITNLSWEAEGYVNGAMDALIEASMVCPPKNATKGQAIGIVYKWLASHPEQMKQPADRLVQKALGQMWPCKKLNP